MSKRTMLSLVFLTALILGGYFLMRWFGQVIALIVILFVARVGFYLFFELRNDPPVEPRAPNQGGTSISS